MDWVDKFQKQPWWLKALIVVVGSAFTLFVIWYDVQVMGR